TIVGDGDLTIASRLPDSRFIKFGTGTLTFTGEIPKNGSTFIVGEGRLRPGAGAPMGLIPVTVDAGATLEVAGVTTRVGAVAGPGTLMLTSGELQIGGAFSPTTFDGDILGPGNFRITAGYPFAYQQADAHARETSTA